MIFRWILKWTLSWGRDFSVGTVSIIFLSSVGFSQTVVISEFMASNQATLEDEDGNSEDWIEVYNPSGETVDLDGWHLTDDAGDLSKWTFPVLALAPGESVVVFASDKNRKDAGGELHTNFKLSTSGEYLGIIRPDGVTVELDFGPAYPLQVTDVSYGLKQEVSAEIILPAGADARFLVPTNGNDDVQDGVNLNSWITTDFDDEAWTLGPTGHGFAVVGGDPYDSLIATDLQTDLYAKQTSVYIRIPFEVDDPSVLTALTLNMNFDDGFVAYLNGDPLPVAEANNPSSDSLNFESFATSSNSDSNALAGADFPLNTSLLNAGINVLSIHGLNRAANNSDALFVATIEGARVTGSIVQAYFNTATPGEVNAPGALVPGPLVRAVTKEMSPINLGAAGLVVEADVIATLNPISTVSLIWRQMFLSEATLEMVDDGSGADAIAGDSVYTAVIPTSDLAAGEMLRWRVSATDSERSSSVAPPYNDRLDSPQYFGTIAQDASVANSNLPVLHWFTSSPAGSETVGGARGSIYYEGEFYDNIQADRHGQSTGGFPKKSFDFDFNKGERFLPYEGGRRAKDVNLITNWADKSKTRNTIGYEIMRKAGHPAHYSFPVRVQQNGQFFSTADLVEDGDDRYLERVALDGNGALYKVYNRLDSATSGINKKTRKDENNGDLAALVSGLGQSGEAKLRYGYDNMNIAGTINYLAALDLTNNRDHGHKNYYVYRDTNETQEWRPLVWDIDLCLGRNWRSGPAYFDDVLRNNNLRSGPTNRMKELVFDDAILNELFRRRVRTLMDEIYGSPAAPINYLETRVNELVALIDPNDNSPALGSDDADLDYRKWGSWGNRNAMRPAADRILTEFIPTRRAQLYGLGELPGMQAIAPTIEISTVDFNPASSGASVDQGGEYLVLSNPNNRAVDCSNWTISGGISITLPPGAVIPKNGDLHVSREAVGFRARAISPKANEKRYLVSGYDGQLSARGETLTLSDALGNVIDTLNFPGMPTPAQMSLRVSEILYAPSDPTMSELALDSSFSASDFEFIELTNTGSVSLDLGGARFSDGVIFTFGAGIDLLPGEQILIVASAAAFELRNGPGLPVAGQFTGSLSNKGETLQVIDAAGENILEFSYGDDWYPQVDGGGHTLVMLDPSGTPFTDFDLAENWGVSLIAGGDPGVISGETALTYEFWKNQRFTVAELNDDLISGASVDLDHDGKGTFLEYAFGMDPLVAEDQAGYKIGREILEGEDFQVFTYRRQKFALDLVYRVEASDNLIAWEPQTNTVRDPLENGDGTASLTVRDAAPVLEAPSRFMRITVAIAP